MGLSKDEIIEWYHKYNYPENEDSLLRNIELIKTPDDFKLLLLGKDGVLKWKGALRTKHYYGSLSPEKWKVLFEITKGSTEKPKETVKRIRAFSIDNMSYRGKSGGINYPVASTLVYFFSKGKCPVIDWRVIFALKDKGYGERLKRIYLYPNKKTGGHQIYLEGDGWNDYYDLCHEIVLNLKIESIENDTPLRVLDKALWMYPDIKKNQCNDATINAQSTTVKESKFMKECNNKPFKDIAIKRKLGIRELYKQLEGDSLTKRQGYATTPEQREENVKRVRELAKKRFDQHKMN